MKKAKKVAVSILCGIMAVFLCFSLNIYSVKAASSASVSVEGASGNVGDEVSVKVTISSSDEISGTTIYLSYDASALQYVSGGDIGSAGSVMWIDHVDTFKTKTRTVNFKVLKAGETTVSVSSGSRVASPSEDYMQVHAGSGTVKGNAPSTASSDNYLSSLKVSPGTLSPAFSRDVTEYTMTVGGDVAKLVVSATARSPQAKISVTGTRMDPGDNKTYITVTAENGTKKTYVISTYKDVQSQTEPDDGGKETPAEPVTPDEDAKEIAVGDNRFAIDGDFEAHPVPAGFEASTVIIDDTEVPAAKGFSDKITLVYLVSLDGNAKAGYYIYDSVKKSYDYYIDIEQLESHYAYLPVTSGMEIPSGFEIETMEIEGCNVDVLKPSGRKDTAEFYLFYGMDSSGKAGWYVYDMKYSTVQRFFFDGTVNEYFSDANVEKATAAPALAKATSKLNDNLKTVIVIISLALSVVCLIIAIVSVGKLHKKR